MAGYGRPWQGVSGSLGTAAYSFRNPTTKAPMNNNPMGNQASMTPTAPGSPNMMAQRPAMFGTTSLPRPTQSPGGRALQGVIAGIQSNPETQPSLGTGRNPYSSPDLQGPVGVARGMNSFAQTESAARFASPRQTPAPGRPQLINPNAARNVLMGQSPDASTAMRPLNIPGMKMDGNRMVPVSPYEARGFTPGSQPNLLPEVARADGMASDDFRAVTGGNAMYAPNSPEVLNRSASGGVNSSTMNARIARAARMRGVTSAGIDQWRASSPIAAGMQKANQEYMDRVKPSTPAPPPVNLVEQPPQVLPMLNQPAAPMQASPLALAPQPAGLPVQDSAPATPDLPPMPNQARPADPTFANPNPNLVKPMNWLLNKAKPWQMVTGLR